MRLTTAYFPPLEWFAAAHSDGAIQLEAHENYQKSSWRNRCSIAGPNGVQRLSIPLEKGKHQQTPVREVKISYAENWQQLHWRSIKTAYGNAPFFEYYADHLERFYTSKPVFLFDYNLTILEFILEKTTWELPVSFTGGYALPEIREPYTPVRYAQVFEDRHGFLPGLSVLDALMCCGKNIQL